MALMFARLAHNFIKNGYFPTDEETISRVLGWLAPCAAGSMRILDPTAGEGTALAECKHHLGSDRAQAFGVEYDAERAWHAKTLLDVCAHGDFQDCIVGRNKFGLLWLNPPYGDLVSDKAHTGEQAGKGRRRLEKLFYNLALPGLQFGGVMVLIVPRYSLDREFSVWLARQFDRVQVFAAPEQGFKQVVVFGVRKRVNDHHSAQTSESAVRNWLEGIGAGEGTLEELPPEYLDEPYTVPKAPDCGDTPVLIYTKLDPAQLGNEIERHRCLWTQFELKFKRAASVQRPPLRAMSNWHLALALAAGQVSGVVRAGDGRVFVIKGDTHKEKAWRSEFEQTDDGEMREIRVATDIFVPVIRALDFTPYSDSFGQTITIR